MSKPKIEVGQVWKDEENDFTREPIAFFKDRGVDEVAYIFTDGNGVRSAGSRSIPTFISGHILIKDKDGNPVKQWREVTTKELLLEGFSEYPLPCQVRNGEGEEWGYVELVGVGKYQGFEARNSFWEQCRIEVKP